MKKSEGFWRSLEIYTWKVAGRSPLPYSNLISGLVMVVVVSSLFGKSLSGARSAEEATRMAASRGDYTLARQLLTNQQTSGASSNLVLGVSTDLPAQAGMEDLVYPEKVVERRITELEEKLREYPGNRQIYLTLAGLYEQLGNQEKSSEYREKARVLDPNE